MTVVYRSSLSPSGSHFLLAELCLEQAIPRSLFSLHFPCIYASLRVYHVQKRQAKLNSILYDIIDKELSELVGVVCGPSKSTCSKNETAYEQSGTESAIQAQVNGASYVFHIIMPNSSHSIMQQSSYPRQYTAFTSDGFVHELSQGFVHLLSASDSLNNISLTKMTRISFVFWMPNSECVSVHTSIFFIHVVMYNKYFLAFNSRIAFKTNNMKHRLR